MTSTAYAPFNVSYAARTPIISPAEFTNAPTAQDVMNLIAGTNQANQTALQETINRASSWCDQHLFGAWGTIASTVEVENARVWGSYRNTLLVHTKYWPLTEVQTFAYTPLPGGLAFSAGASITPSGAITIYPTEFEVVTTGTVSFSGTGQSGFGGFGATSGITRRVEYDTQYQYVAGFPNTMFTASVAAGASVVSPVSTVGIYPGSLMTIYDLPYDEPVTVASSYVPGSAIVPLTAPLQYSHGANATITNLPPAIKQACIWATVAFIKQRGSGSLIAADIGDLTKTQTGFAQGAGSDFGQAMRLLNAFRQTYVGW